MTLIIENDTRRYIRDLARILTELYRYEGYDVYYRAPTVEELESWFRSMDPDYDPLETAVVETSKGIVVGYADAWVMDDYQPGYIRVIVDPILPEPLYTEAYASLLRWAGRTLAYYDRSVNPITIYAGREYSRSHITLESMLGGSLTQVDSGTLMEYRGSLSNPIPPGLVEELVVENPGETVVRELVEVVNDAFSIYPDHYPWSFERAWNYYSTRFGKSKGEFFIIVLRNKDTGEIAGMTEITYYDTAAGGKVGYVALLAVRRDYQRRGLGRYLLSRASAILRRIGVERLVLDSVPEARRMYEKLGFSPVFKWVKVRVPLEAVLSI